jgi:hypothetical protein
MATITVVTGTALGPVYTARSNDDWLDLSSSPVATWANWRSWNTNPTTVQIKVFEDAGSIDARLPLLDVSVQGAATYSLKISNTVDSNLNLVSPTTINFSGTTTYSFVSGRYYEYTITATGNTDTPIPVITGPQIIFEKGGVEEYLYELNTATLSGTIDARELDSTIGVVTTLVATAKEAGVTYSNGSLRDRVYAIPDDYVFQENAIIVNTVSKSPPKIRCFDLNGESIDALVDVYLKGLPKITATASGIVVA